MANVLITGIAGFIGSTLARGLLAEGATVRGIDNLSTGKLANLEEIRTQIDLRQGDIADAAEIEAACRGIDIVFHEAALGSVPRSVANPMASHQANATGTLAVLEAARKAGVKRLIYASSSSAYGANLALPKVETMRPDPISPYAVQKLTGEHYVTSFARVYGMETVSLRYFNVFGPRQDPTSQYAAVLTRFIAQMSNGQTPTIFGDGSTSRDFTFVENVVSANLLAAKCTGNIAGKVFNIAAGGRITLLEAYETIKEIVGYEGVVAFQPDRAGDIKHSLADISAAQSLLGYRVLVDFRQGLEKTVAWHRSQRPSAP